MSGTYTPPSTVDGIKRLAKTIKRDRGLAHHEALDEAARRSGFANFRAFRRQLEMRTSRGQVDHHEVFLTSYWQGASYSDSGRLTLLSPLVLPLNRLLSPREVRVGRNLRDFRIEAEDHLERRYDAETYQEAEEKLIAAARTLQFMAATGLRPYRLPNITDQRLPLPKMRCISIDAGKRQSIGDL